MCWPHEPWWCSCRREERVESFSPCATKAKKVCSETEMMRRSDGRKESEAAATEEGECYERSSVAAMVMARWQEPSGGERGREEVRAGANERGKRGKRCHPLSGLGRPTQWPPWQPHTCHTACAFCHGRPLWRAPARGHGRRGKARGVGQAEFAGWAGWLAPAR